MWRRKLLQHQYRDVSSIFAYIREVGLGRVYNLFNRFAPNLSPRSIPKPEIPRGPEYKYSNQHYYKRSAYDSVHPPVVAPIALGPSPKQNKFQPVAIGGMPANLVFFPGLPTPGDPYWWDGHFYYKCVPEPLFKPTERPPLRKPPICEQLCPKKPTGMSC